MLFAQSFQLPPPSTDWIELVAIGTAYVFAIVAMIRRQAPKIDGWAVPVALVPIVAALVALYQVGFEDLRLTGKHAVLLYVGAYGGAAGVRKLGAWAIEALEAAWSRRSIPPPPSMRTEPYPSDPPSSDPPPDNVRKIPAAPKPPTFPPILGTIALLLAFLVGLAMITGCGSPITVAAQVADAAAVVGEQAAPVLADRCTTPLREAVALGDVAKGRALAEVCDPAMATYDALRLAHVALRAALVAAVGGQGLAELGPLVAEVASASAGFAQTMIAITRGAK